MTIKKICFYNLLHKKRALSSFFNVNYFYTIDNYLYCLSYFYFIFSLLSTA